MCSVFCFNFSLFAFGELLYFERTVGLTRFVFELLPLEAPPSPSSMRRCGVDVNLCSCVPSCCKYLSLSVAGWRWPSLAFFARLAGCYVSFRAIPLCGRPHHGRERGSGTVGSFALFHLHLSKEKQMGEGCALFSVFTLIFLLEVVSRAITGIGG